MNKTIYSKLSKAFCKHVVSMRQSAGLTQRQFAEKVGREPSFIARIEQGERRVDLIEFHLLCEACGVSSQKMAAKILKDFTKN